MGDTADVSLSPDGGPAEDSAIPDSQTADTGFPDAARLDIGKGMDTGADEPCRDAEVRPCPDPACANGEQHCEDGTWGACIGTAEICNERDDDCDGQTDESFDGLGEACTGGVGACARPGLLTCNDDGDGVKCDATPGDPEVELCDGLDNDCNGETDEGFEVGAACESGSGECRASGEVICGQDGGSACSAEPGFPGAERCNGLDDDCDGEVDEGFDLGGDCSVGTGLCLARGHRVCGPQGNAICGARAGEPLPEECNGLDDNCDGEVDEGFPSVGNECSSGVGACERPGHFVCNDAADGVRCDATAGLPGMETCNGIDDDCDGLVDDGFGLGAACVEGEGACARTGSTVCNANGTAECSAVPGDPSDEVCDGLDNDCNGDTDEDAGGQPIEAPCYDGPHGTLDVGVCRAGSHVCQNGGFAECGQQVLPSAEICDTLDNDCDGVVDDGIVGLGAACGTGRPGACSAGHQVCSPLGLTCRQDVQPTPESCDNIDNDCDGLLDNGTGRGDPCTAGAGVCARPGHVVCAEGGGTTCDAVPGQPAATDTCDGLDNNCNGVIDDGCPLSIAPDQAAPGALQGGGAGGNAYTSQCPAGQVIRGFDVEPGSVYELWGLRPKCAQLSLNTVAGTIPAIYDVRTTPGADAPYAFDDPRQDQT